MTVQKTVVAGIRETQHSDLIKPAECNISREISDQFVRRNTFDVTKDWQLGEEDEEQKHVFTPSY